MKTYNCACGELLFFENITCVNCSREVGFLPDLAFLSSLEKPDDKVLDPVSASEGKGRLYKKCQNYAQHNVCNWMVPAENNEAFCTSCRLDVVIPDLSMPKNL